jgi:iron-sulfur cluster repair protein YtfE (RIC family)
MCAALKRHKALHILSHEHHQGLILSQLIKKGNPKYKKLPDTIKGKKDYSIRFYNDELIKHFEDEEKILFSFIKGKDDEIDNLFEEIITEHKKIRQLFSQLELDEDVEKTMDELGHILESHIRKEERNLFGKIQEILTKDELAALENQLSGSRKIKK